MPSYHARGITLRLGVAPLSDTITHKLVLKKGEVAKQQCEAAEEKLRESKLLEEESVSFPGGEGGYDLNWLGNAPFMQVQVGRGLFERQTPLSALADTDASKMQDGTIPQALVLHVNLSSRTFTSGLDGGSQVQIKIDVLFNGQLSSCRFVPLHDIRSGAQSLHQIFSGHRTDYLAERPYVIMSPDMTTDNNTTYSQSATSAEKRWDQISLALQKEADARGTDKHNNAPPSAEFLHALSTMQIPEQTKNMQKLGGRKFGVIDIIITAGFGKKITSGTSYLKAPQRLEDNGFVVDIDRDGNAIEVKARRPNQDNKKQVRDSVHCDPEDETELCYGSVSDQPGLTAVFDVVPAPGFAHPFTGMRIPRIPLSSRGTTSCLFSPATSQVSSRLPSPQKRTPDRLRASCSPKRGLAGVNYDVQDKTTQRDWDSNDDLYHTPHDRLFIRNYNPYSFQLSDSGLAHNLLDDPTDFNPHGIAGSMSSPVRHSAISQNIAAFRPPIHDSQRPSRPFRAHLNSGPYVASMTPMYELDQTYHGLFGSVNTHSGAPFVSPSRVLHHIRQEAFASSLPFPSVYHEPYEPCRLPLYPYVVPSSYHNSGSLPPAGLYSVPGKPRHSTSPPKLSQKLSPADLGPTDDIMSKPSYLVTRLVILGKYGITLIDHRWSVPQHIRVGQIASFVNVSAKDFPVETGRCPDSGTHSERLRRQSRSPAKILTPLIISPIENATTSSVFLSTAKGKRDGVHDGQWTPTYLPAGSTGETSTLVRGPEFETKSARSHDQGVLMGSLVFTPPAPPPRRSTLRNSGLCVQVSKATTYVFEDSEEVLREAKRLRRSRSPTKLGSEISVLPRPTATTLADAILSVSKKTTSSPLSSVPSTPELKPQIILEDTVQRRQSLQRPINTFAQVDRSPEHPISPNSPHKIGTRAVTSFRKLNSSSPSKGVATPIRQLQNQIQGTPQSSPSFGTKKRKFAKQTRSLHRFNTAKNPPLNRDCVIAFAENEEKESEKVILRQIKGERQGMFHEEYIVLASRFFVTGE